MSEENKLSDDLKDIIKLTCLIAGFLSVPVIFITSYQIINPYYLLWRQPLDAELMIRQAQAKACAEVINAKAKLEIQKLEVEEYKLEREKLYGR